MFLPPLAGRPGDRLLTARGPRVQGFRDRPSVSRREGPHGTNRQDRQGKVRRWDGGLLCPGIIFPGPYPQGTATLLSCPESPALYAAFQGACPSPPLMAMPLGVYSRLRAKVNPPRPAVTGRFRFFFRAPVTRPPRRRQGATVPARPSVPASAPSRSPSSESASDVVRWAAFCCVLVPVVLVVYGTSAGGAAAAALGLAAVTAACRVLLRQSERQSAHQSVHQSGRQSDHPRGRRARTAQGAHRGGRRGAGSAPVG
jgi:hypothetical protein